MQIIIKVAKYLDIYIKMLLTALKDWKPFNGYCDREAKGGIK